MQSAEVFKADLKHSLLEAGKMDELDFRYVFREIRLLLKGRAF